MKLRSVIKLDKKNTGTSKKFGDGVMSINCDIIVFFWIYGQFAAIRSRILNAWSKTYILNKNNLLSHKN